MVVSQHTKHSPWGAAASRSLTGCRGELPAAGGLQGGAKWVGWWGWGEVDGGEESSMRGKREVGIV